MSTKALYPHSGQSEEMNAWLSVNEWDLESETPFTNEQILQAFTHEANQDLAASILVTIMEQGRLTSNAQYFLSVLLNVRGYSRVCVDKKLTAQFDLSRAEDNFMTYRHVGSPEYNSTAETDGTSDFFRMLADVNPDALRTILIRHLRVARINQHTAGK